MRRKIKLKYEADVGTLTDEEAKEREEILRKRIQELALINEREIADFRKEINNRNKKRKLIKNYLNKLQNYQLKKLIL